MNRLNRTDGDGQDDEAGDSDEIIRCVVAGLPVRIVAAVTTGVAREAARRHDAGPAAAMALGRGLTAGLLLATLTKDDERVTLQVLGNGPLGGITVDANAAGTARAYVKHPEAGRIDEASPRPSLGGAVGGSGLVSVIRDVGLRENFSGQTAIRNGEIDQDVERYLTDSEQIESALACDTIIRADGGITASAGMLVQALPGSEGAIEVVIARALFAEGALAQAIGAGVPASGEALMAAVFAGRLGQIQVLDRRPVRFFCPCSRQRAGASLAMLGEADLSEMILDDGKAEVICNFCRARYDFDDEALERIRRETRGTAGPAS